MICPCTGLDFWQRKSCTVFNYKRNTYLFFKEYIKSGELSKVEKSKSHSSIESPTVSLPGSNYFRFMRALPKIVYAHANIYVHICIYMHMYLYIQVYVYIERDTHMNSIQTHTHILFFCCDRLFFHTNIFWLLA